MLRKTGFCTKPEIIDYKIGQSSSFAPSRIKSDHDCVCMCVTAQHGNSWRAGFVMCFIEFMVHQGLSAAIILCTCSSLYASLCFCENSSSSRVTISCSLYLPAYVYNSYKAQFVLNSVVCNWNKIKQKLVDMLGKTLILRFIRCEYKSR